MLRKIFSLFAIAFLCASCNAQKPTRIWSDDSRLVYLGRVSHKTPGCARFTYPGIQIHAQFTGTSVAMVMKPGSGYYMVEIDKREAFKVHSEDKDSVVRLADGLDEGVHRLTITSCNEGHSLKPEFHGLLLDHGADLDKRPTMHKRKMEFIGNSITCALGIEDYSKDHKQSNSSTQNAYYSFAHQTARRLNSQCVLVSRSGIGVYRNTGGPKQGDKNNMQACYPNTFFTFDANAERWDFSRYTPDVVCINLGTNDTTYPAYDTTLLTNAFVNFVHTVRGNYPDAKIVLLSGTMRKGKLLADLLLSLDNAVKKLKEEGETEVYRFDFTPDDGSLGYGSSMHPSLKRHTRMADELTPFIEKITGW